MMLSLILLCLLYFGQSETTTFLTFSRRIDTCDSDDHPLEDSTTNVIWSFNSHDPINDTILQHEQRGSKSVRFFQTDQNGPKLPPDAENFEIKLNKQPILFNDPNFEPGTQYWCSAYKVTIPSKRHVIRVEPIIDPANTQMVHHMLAFMCYPLNDTDLSYQGGCYQNTTPPAIKDCDQHRLFGGWAVGGAAMDYPAAAGYPVNGTLYIVIETHYNNPEHKNFSDSSGFRFWHTGQLRNYDAGISVVGHTVDPTYQIPAGQAAYQTDAWCDAGCLQSSLPETGINISSALLHTHTAGRQIYFRQYRNGTELPVILEEPYYDFNYQSFQPLPQERTVKRGDILKTECVYNTVDRTNPTPMGYSTAQEMCLAYFVYYPLTEMDYCAYMNYTALDPSYPAYTFCGTVKQTDDVPEFIFIKPNLTAYVPPVCTYNPPPVNNSNVFTVTNVFNKSIYQNTLTLDDNGAYQLYWTVDRENGVYHGAVEVKTEGWVGLGLSQGGGMVNADILIGWQKDGVLHFADRHSLQQGVVPLVDAHQDFYNVAGGEIVTLNSPNTSPSDLVNRPTKIGVSVAGSVIGVLLIFLIIYCCLRRNKNKKIAVAGDEPVVTQKDTHNVDNNNTPTTIHTASTTTGHTAQTEDQEPLKETEFLKNGN